MTKPVAFSYSRLDSFETCPKKYWEISVAKRVKDEGNEFTVYGEEVHKAFAEYFLKNKSLPMHLSQYQKILSPIKGAPGRKYVEQKLALNASYEGTDWFAKDAYVRVISDLTILNGERGILFDWKTGKRKDDFTQLKLAGAVVFLLDEDVQELQLVYFWTKDKKFTFDRLTRTQMPEVFNALAPRLQRYQDAHAQQEFPARPSENCKWCPVTTCPYWEKRK
jgi:hypothetical protein